MEKTREKRTEAYPAKAAGQGQTSAKGNRTGNAYGTYYPYWLRGKVAHVRRVTI